LVFLCNAENLLKTKSKPTQVFSIFLKLIENWPEDCIGGIKTARHIFGFNSIRDKNEKWFSQQVAHQLFRLNKVREGGSWQNTTVDILKLLKNSFKTKKQFETIKNS
jgi:hypothetical protein